MKTLLSFYPFNLQTSPEQYRKVFFIAAAISFFGGTFFLLFGSGEQQNWDKSNFASDYPAEKMFVSYTEITDEHYSATANEQESRPLLNDNQVVPRDYRGTKSL